MAAALLLPLVFTIRGERDGRDKSDRAREGFERREKRKAGGDRENNRFGQRAQIRAL